MKVKELIKILKTYNKEHEVFFLDEKLTKSYNITKTGTIDGIDAVILGSRACNDDYWRREK